jgi:hypothetical protein
MNAAINVNVSVALTASDAIAVSAPVVISRTMSPPQGFNITQKAGWTL